MYINRPLIKKIVANCLTIVATAPAAGSASVVDLLKIASGKQHPTMARGGRRRAFFDTYKTLGVVTEIMGITPEGWKAIEQMQKIW